jgi:hypothetical protein
VRGVFGSISALLGGVIDAAGTVVGYRHGAKEPDYRSERLTGDVEIRHYGARIAAETIVVADEEAARYTGFRRLAGYIFGSNGVHEKIAMTAPVAQEAAGDRKWVIRFFMPADRTLDSLPEPDDGEVRLAAVPAETVAVHRFTGSRSRRAVAARTAKLMTTLRESGFRAVDTPEAWFYDPPWTVPTLRRNEIAVAVEPA